ncbi:MAG: protein-disulfide reductase DsbD domain-containing protein, partial [Gammaproteobacteria bacterium]
MRNLIKLLCCFMLFFTSASYAVDVFHVNKDPLPADQAYQFSATRNGNTMTAHWTMASGYYLYHNKFCFIVNGQRLNNVVLPAAQTYTDPVLGSFK